MLNPREQFESAVVGLSGTVTGTVAGSAHKDNPYLHPFGNDWECWIAIDRNRGFEQFLAPSNAGSTGTDDYGRETRNAQRLVQDVQNNPDIFVPSTLPMRA